MIKTRLSKLVFTTQKTPIWYFIYRTCLSQVSLNIKWVGGDIPSVSSVRLKLSLDDKSCIELFDNDGDTTA